MLSGSGDFNFLAQMDQKLLRKNGKVGMLLVMPELRLSAKVSTWLYGSCRWLSPYMERLEDFILMIPDKVTTKQRHFVVSTMVPLFFANKYFYMVWLESVQTLSPRLILLKRGIWLSVTPELFSTFDLTTHWRPYKTLTIQYAPQIFK